MLRDDAIGSLDLPVHAIVNVISMTTLLWVTRMVGQRTYLRNGALSLSLFLSSTIKSISVHVENVSILRDNIRFHLASFMEECNGINSTKSAKCWKKIRMRKKKRRERL